MHSKANRFWGVALTTLVLLIAMTLMLSPTLSVFAQPPTLTPTATPTQVYPGVPVASLPMIKSGNAAYVELFPLTVVDTGTIYGPPIEVIPYNSSEIFYTIRQGVVTNTVDVKLQYSNDGVLWLEQYLVEDGEVTARGFITDTEIFGRLNRIAVSVASTSPVTVTVNGVLDSVR